MRYLTLCARVLCALSVIVGMGACVDEVKVIEFPLESVGAGAQRTRGDGWIITLSQAKLAFGPLYLCAGTQAGAGCDEVVGEMLEPVIVDVLDTNVRSERQVVASPAFVGNWMYDLGVEFLAHTKRTLHQLCGGGAWSPIVCDRGSGGKRWPAS